MTYLYWRGRSLWSSYPARHPLGIIRSTDSKSEIARCIAEGEKAIARERLIQQDRKFFDRIGLAQVPEQESKVYKPKFWRLVGRYWYHHLRFQKSGANERFHLAHCLKAFGGMYADEITREAVETWRQEMRTSGASVNSVNNRFAYLQAVFAWAAKESRPHLRILTSPATGLQKLPGAKVRTFLLTQEKFERNYALLREGKRWPNKKPSKHCTPWMIPPDPRFALFYLALWETGRRPLEVSQYGWEMLHEQEIDGRMIRYFEVPPGITKTDDAGRVVISARLWQEMTRQAWRTGLVFLNAEGQRWKHWSRHKRKLERVYGQDAGWIRDCRRGFITRKCEVEGRDPYHVRMQSGHRTDSIFRRYRIGQLSNQAAIFAEDFFTRSSQLAKTG